MPLGFRPSEDPSWRHIHVPTGETGYCSRCPATWVVTCHNGHRRYCENCAQAVKRIRDRAYQKHRRFQKRWEAADRSDIVWMLAFEYASEGEFETRNDGTYTVDEWRMIHAEATLLGLELASEWLDDDADYGGVDEVSEEATADLATITVPSGDRHGQSVLSRRQAMSSEK